MGEVWELRCIRLTFPMKVLPCWIELVENSHIRSRRLDTIPNNVGSLVTIRLLPHVVYGCIVKTLCRLLTCFRSKDAKVLSESNFDAGVKPDHGTVEDRYPSCSIDEQLSEHVLQVA